MAKFDIVFEGGGAKGSVFVGAMEEFFKAGHEPWRLVGTSAGAITAALLAVGYTPEQMLTAVTETDSSGKPRFASFMDPPLSNDFDVQLRANCELAEALQNVKLIGVPARVENRLKQQLLGQLLDRSDHFRHFFNLVECGGWYSGVMFVTWLNEKLKAKGIENGCTLSQLHTKTTRHLSLVATDTTRREMLVLNHYTAPDLPVAMAVRMSMSIPFVWREVTWDSAWGEYMRSDRTGNKIVDGGVLSNFPIDLVATRNPRTMKLMGSSGDPAEAGTLGLLIDENLPVTRREEAVPSAPAQQTRLRTVQRIQRLIDTMTGARDTALIHEYAANVCRLPAAGYGTTEFDMPKEKLRDLVDAGRIAMRDYLASLPKTEE